MKLRRIMAVVYKQSADKTYSRSVLIQFLLFPVLMVLLSLLMPVRKDIAPNTLNQLYLSLFAPMFTGMMPMMAMSNVIVTEKYSNTLRVLIMSTVKPIEYLIGISLYILMASFVTGIIFGLFGGFLGVTFLLFIAVFMVGVLTSLLLGSAIGIKAANQTGMTNFTMPIMIIMSLVPVFGMFNKSIYNVSRFIYTQQLNSLFNDMSRANFTWDKIAVIFLNMIIFFILFMISYRKNKFYA